MTVQSLEPIAEKISKHLGYVEKARDTSYVLHREIIKKSSLSIRATHRKEKDEANKLLMEALEKLERAREATNNVEGLFQIRFMQDAEKEFAEAYITYNVVFAREIPDPDVVNVSYQAYLNGLAEVVGELRREILDLMRQDRAGEGEFFLQVMDEIYSILVTMDFSDAVTGGLRRSTDQARAILERTRGDFTNYIVSQRLRKDLDKVIKKLEG